VREDDERDRRDAFEAAYRAHYWQVVAYAARRLGPGEDAARDAAQETFAVAWRRRADLPETPLPWLYAVAAHVVRNAQRGDRRRDRLAARLQAVPDAPGAERAPAPASGALVADVDDDPVGRALDRLSAADQEVLRLAAWEDLGTAEIAQVLGCSANTAAARLSRAEKRLRAALDVPVQPPPATAKVPLRPPTPAAPIVNDKEVRRA
jgi:RNA polymerase sigma factor (sigma-70 family)